MRAKKNWGDFSLAVRHTQKGFEVFSRELLSVNS